MKKNNMTNFLHPIEQPKKNYVLQLQCKYNVGFERTLYKQFQPMVPQWKYNQIKKNGREKSKLTKDVEFLF
jgi:hypothetical protein